MAKFTNETIKCAYCRAESEHRVLLSHSSLGEIDLDTRPTDMARGLLEYEIQECPHCHYSSIRIDDGNMPAQLPDRYGALITDEAIPPLPKKFIMAAWLKEIINEFEFAGELYLRAAWAFDDLNDNAGAINARNAAIINFSKYVDGSNDGEVAITIVDLMRRVGRFEEAMEMIEDIGSADDEFYDGFLALEKTLIENRDTSCHNTEEI